MKRKDPIKKSATAVSKKKKARVQEVPSDKEIRELESLGIPEKVKMEVCEEVAEQMGISVEEVMELMEELESGISSRKFVK
jgi:predicted peroxiredoxin